MQTGLYFLCSSAHWCCWKEILAVQLPFNIISFNYTDYLPTDPEMLSSLLVDKIWFFWCQRTLGICMPLNDCSATEPVVELCMQNIWHIFCPRVQSLQWIFASFPSSIAFFNLTSLQHLSYLNCHRYEILGSSVNNRKNTFNLYKK